LLWLTSLIILAVMGFSGCRPLGFLVVVIALTSSSLQAHKSVEFIDAHLQKCAELIEGMGKAIQKNHQELAGSLAELLHKELSKAHPKSWMDVMALQSKYERTMPLEFLDEMNNGYSLNPIREEIEKFYAALFGAKLQVMQQLQVMMFDPEAFGKQAERRAIEELIFAVLDPSLPHHAATYLTRALDSPFDENAELVASSIWTLSLALQRKLGQDDLPENARSHYEEARATLMSRANRSAIRRAENLERKLNAYRKNHAHFLGVNGPNLFDAEDSLRSRAQMSEKESKLLLKAVYEVQGWGSHPDEMMTEVGLHFIHDPRSAVSGPTAIEFNTHAYTILSPDLMWVLEGTDNDAIEAVCRLTAAFEILLRKTSSTDSARILKRYEEDVREARAKFELEKPERIRAMIELILARDLDAVLQSVDDLMMDAEDVGIDVLDYHKFYYSLRGQPTPSAPEGYTLHEIAELAGKSDIAKALLEKLPKPTRASRQSAGNDSP